MEMKSWLASSPMLAAIGLMAFLPVPSMAASNQSSEGRNCGSCAATVMPQARDLLNHVERDAQQVSQRAQSLATMADSPNLNRTRQAKQLQRIQNEVDDMHTRLAELNGMKQSLPGPDRQAVNSATSMVQLMSTNTSNAIGDLDSNIQYGGYTQILNNEAQTVAQDISTSVQSSDRRQRAAYYQENLGMLPVFGD